MKSLFSVLFFMLVSISASAQTDKFHISGDFYGENYHSKPSPFDNEKVSVLPMIYYGKGNRNLFSLNCHRSGDSMYSRLFDKSTWRNDIYLEFDGGDRVKVDIKWNKQHAKLTREVVDLMIAKNTMYIYTSDIDDHWSKERIDLSGFSKAYDLACHR